MIRISVLLSVLSVSACVARAQSNNLGSDPSEPAKVLAAPFRCDLVVTNNSGTVVEEAHQDSDANGNVSLQTTRFSGYFGGTSSTLQFTPAMVYTMTTGTHANLNAAAMNGGNYDVLRANLDCAAVAK